MTFPWQKRSSCQLDGRGAGKYYRLTLNPLQGYLISFAALAPSSHRKATDILGPAQNLSGELITILSIMILTVLLSGSWRSGLSRSQRIQWVAMTAGALTITALLTPRAVFFLPVFFILSFSSAGKTGGTVRRQWDFPAFSIFMGAFCLGVFLSWLQSPETTAAGYANILQPLLGSRWLSNLLWMLFTSTLLTFIFPRKPLSLLRIAGLNSPGGVALLFWANSIMITSIYYRFLPSMGLFAQYLLFTCGFMMAVAAIIFAVSSTRLRAAFWMMLAIFSVLGSWFMISPPVGVFTFPGNGGLNKVLVHIQRNDILFLGESGFEFWEFGVPFDRAALGNIQTFNTDKPLKSILADPGLTRNHETVWILPQGESTRPWEVVFKNSAGEKIKAGKAGSFFVLHQLNPDLLPSPVIIFSNGGKDGTITRMQGLHKDGDWTDEELNLVFDFPGISAEHLDIVLKGWRPDEATPLDQKLVIQLNNKTLKLQMMEKSFFRFIIPPETLMAVGNDLSIQAPTFVPRDLDQSKSDKRILGLDLDEIILR